ncbi:RloB family protein [Leucothrix pacifica]|uniref:RloB family protein n=1 Tax=Leucothrix pacifica TaxID=1247513 RepID=UPI001C63C0AF|nr:RloB family protein [Leucothrix pacifica]
MAKRRSFPRPSAQRRYRKLFVLAVEGTVTEPQYFQMFNSEVSIIQVKCLKGGHKSGPFHVLKRMKKYLDDVELRKTDEAWLVVDKDEWSDSQLNELYQWSASTGQYGLALSNPKFEYWLLLHYEQGKGVSSSRSCTERLNRYIKNYDKGIEGKLPTLEQVKNAVERAKLRDTPPCKDWPRESGQSTVYKLVEAILQSDE